MAEGGKEDSAQEKTEEPTDKKREQFRDEGQIAKSQEITSFVAIVCSVVVFALMAADYGTTLANALRGGLTFTVGAPMGSFLAWAKIYMYPVVIDIFSFGIILLIVVTVASLAQTGIVFSKKSITPKLSHIDPVQGTKRLFSVNSLVNFAKQFAKVVVIGLLVYLEIKNKLTEIVFLSDRPLIEALNWYGSLIAILILKISIFLALVALFDYIYQYFSIRKKMMMSRQELKDELKDTQVSDNIRNKVRQVAQERARREIQQEVPNADVVVTNPTHYAVALRYERHRDTAPRVVAKGKDLLAKTIKRVATENEVPLYEYPVLARSLYKDVKVGSQIPRDLYESVAKVLSYVYKLHRNRGVVRA